MHHRARMEGSMIARSRLLFARHFKRSLPLDQERHAERSLAVARAAIALALLLTGLAWPSPSAPPSDVLFLLALYAAFASGALGVLYRRPDWWTVRPVTMHVVDLTAATVVAWGTSGVASPFFGLFMFSLLAAAYRWGFAETMATATVGVMLLGIHAALVTSVFSASLIQGNVEPDPFVLRSTYLLAAGLLAGYLSRSEKRFRLEAMTIARIVARADVRDGLKRTMSQVFGALLQLFGARRIVLVVHETDTDRLFLWDATRTSGGAAPAVSASLLASRDLDTFMFEPDAGAWHAVVRQGRRGERLDVMALNGAGRRLTTEGWTLPRAFLDAVPAFDGLLAFRVDAGPDWTGRMFLLDPEVGSDRTGALELGRRVIAQVFPALRNVYHLRKVRLAACAAERGRIARELHDGVIQGVMGV